MVFCGGNKHATTETPVSAAFKTMDDLATSIRAAGLGLYEKRMLETARPCLCFLRHQELDAQLLPGTSKIGGIPDLPPGFTWPSRPPLPDPERAADATRKIGAGVRDMMAKYVDNPEPWMGKPPTQATLEAITAKFDAQARVYFDPFPLAFFAQLNLAQLSREAGFDPDMPKTGLLSIFMDATSGGHFPFPRVFWHDGSAGDLVRTPPPARLIEHCDRANASGEDDWWASKSKAEVLYPASAFVVPDHWKRVVSFTSRDGKAIWDWFDDPHGAFRMEPPPEWSADGSSLSSNFGDRMGGWPSNIQGNPEDEMGDTFAGGATPILVPGQTRWRQIFAWGGEYYGDTLLPAQANPGDGTTYVLIERDDLLARRFERAGYIYQMD
jgi:Domain of unknown function (DUF1963)